MRQDVSRRGACRAVRVHVQPVAAAGRTQSLKDQCFSLLMTCACTSAWFLFEPLITGTWRRDPRTPGLALAGLIAVTFLAAAIRAYVAFLIVCLTAVLLAAFAWRVGTRRLPGYVICRWDHRPLVVVSVSVGSRSLFQVTTSWRSPGSSSPGIRARRRWWPPRPQPARASRPRAGGRPW